MGERDGGSGLRVGLLGSRVGPSGGKAVGSSEGDFDGRFVGNRVEIGLGVDGTLVGSGLCNGADEGT